MVEGDVPVLVAGLSAPKATFMYDASGEELAEPPQALMRQLMTIASMVKANLVVRDVVMAGLDEVFAFKITRRVVMRTVPENN
jgi:hypothetical protein